jgi:hypothetical protein
MLEEGLEPRDLAPVEIHPAQAQLACPPPAPFWQPILGGPSTSG